jgi:hypothetical protein
VRGEDQHNARNPPFFPPHRLYPSRDLLYPEWGYAKKREQKEKRKKKKKKEKAKKNKEEIENRKEHNHLNPNATTTVKSGTSG